MWLKELQPRDRVCYRVTGIGSGWNLDKVRHVTPTGRIILESGIKLNNKGYKRSSDWHSIEIETITTSVNTSANNKNK